MSASKGSLWILLFLAVALFKTATAATADAGQDPAAGLQADYIIVEKSKRRLTLLHQGQVLKYYRISLGRDPVGPKIREGDDRTPEGLYHIDYRLRDSAYHLALHISYPGPADLERARRLGVDPGGDIMIHGIGGAMQKVGDLHPLFDWTNGCIAVTDREIEEIWRLTPVGTPIRILP